MASWWGFVRRTGGEIVGVAVLIGIEFLGDRSKLEGINPIYAVIRYGFTP